MKLRIFTEPQQGASYRTLRAVALATEELGFDAFFRSDHYLKMGDVSGLPGPTDAWVTLAGLAIETSRIRLGTLMSAATFRHPGPLAISVAQVDQMSGGRVEFGLGAGWFEREHTGYGIPFPPLGERFDRLEEQFAIITGLWETEEGETFSFDGLHYRLTDSPALPKPAQRPRPPVLVGGNGARRTPRLAARFADEFNVAFRTLPDSRAAFARVRDACEAAGRSPASMTYSVAHTVCCGRDETEFRRRAAAIGREPEDMRRNGLGGTPGEVAAKIAAYAEIGADRVYLQILDPEDLDHLALIASDVSPQVQAGAAGAAKLAEGATNGRASLGADGLVAVGALVTQLSGGADQRAQGCERERATNRDPADARLSEFGHGRDSVNGQHVDRAVDLAHDQADVLDVAQARGIENVGTGLLVSLQPGDRVSQVGPAAQVVLRAGGEDKPDVARVRGLSRRRDAFGREFHGVDRVLIPAAEILYRGARQADLDRQLDGFGDTCGIIGEGVLQVGRDWQVRGRDDYRGVY
jgi:F420-dependent oxidoreductase-like protein